MSDGYQDECDPKPLKCGNERASRMGDFEAPSETADERLTAICVQLRKITRLILREQDAQTLIKNICRVLVENQAYEAMWIALLNEDGDVSAIAHQGFGERFRTMEDTPFPTSALPFCGKWAISHSQGSVLTGPQDPCTDCVLGAKNPKFGSMAIRVGHHGKAHGVIVVHTHSLILRREEEQQMLVEVAEDLGFALQAINTTRALRLNEERLRQVTENTTELISIIDSESRITYASPSHSKVMGYEPEELLGRNVFDLAAPEDIPSLIEMMKEAISNKRSRTAVFRAKRKDGHTILVETIGDLLSSKDGSLQGAVFTSRDVSRRVELEQALESANRIVMGSPAVLFRWENKEKWPVEYVSDNCSVLFSHSAEDFMSGVVHFADTIHSDDIETVIDDVNRYSQESGRETFEHEPYRIITKNGLIKWVDNRTTIIRDAQSRITHFEGIVLDISDRKRAEIALEHHRQHLESTVADRTAELREKNKELLAEMKEHDLAEVKATKALSEIDRIFQTAANGLRVVDIDFQVTKANKGMADISGVPLSKIIGSKCYESFPGKHCGQPSCTLKRIREGDLIRGLEVSKKSSTGAEVLCSIQATPYFEGGRLAGMIEDFQDVTEKERLRTIADAVNLSSNIGYIFGGIRHELGNPVNNMKTSLTVMRSRLKDLTLESIDEKLEWALAEISRIEYLLQSLKSYTLFETLNIERADLVEFVSKFRKLATRDLNNREIEVRISSVEESPWVDIDYRALQQVLLNLVSNSVDALADTMQPQVTLEVQPVGDFVQLRVIDNGIGMTEDQIENLFKPFYTNKKKGTGLGLAIAKRLLAKMGAVIKIESKKEEGTVVSILFQKSTAREA